MKKVLYNAMAVVMLIACLFFTTDTTYAANVSVSVSSSKVNIGDKVKVTVTIPENASGTVDLYYDSSLLSFSSASVDVNANVAGTISISMGKYGLAQSNKVTITLKAKTSGSTKVSATIIDAYDNDSYEEISGSGSKTITIENEVVSEKEEPKSADNSLSTLKLSKGTLSPSFKYNVTNYTATVDYDVTSVVVTAKAANEKAKIESVTGDGNVKLSVGKNTIKVVVEAENGQKATYTIVVTRKEKATAPEPSESESESQSESESETEDTPITDTKFEWNGEELTIKAEIPEKSIPKNFESSTLVVGGVELPCLSFKKGDLNLLYLNNANEAGGLYVYDETDESIYPFVKLESEKNYVIVLRANEETVPSGYESCTLSIEGKGIVSAYQLKQSEAIEAVEETETVSWWPMGAETYYAAEPVASDFYLIYCMSNNGEMGWYMYDSVEQTFQRYLASVHTGDVEASAGETGDADLLVKNQKLEKELAGMKIVQMIIIVAAVVLAIVLITVIVILLIRRRSDDYDEYDEEDEEEYLEGEQQEEYSRYAEPVFTEDMMEESVTAEKESEKKSEAEASVEDDDEIEVEFYELPKEAEDDDLEFIDL